MFTNEEELLRQEEIKTTKLIVAKSRRKRAWKRINKLIEDSDPEITRKLAELDEDDFPDTPFAL